MNHLYYDAEDFMLRIISKMEIMLTEQLVMAIKNKYSFESEYNAEVLVRKCQRNGHILLSEDGWCVKRMAYPVLTGDEQFKKIDYGANARIPYPIGDLINNINRDVVDCFWIIASLIPDSENFMLCAEPWAIAFATKTKNTNNSYIPGAYYKIAKINSLEHGTDIIPLMAMISDSMKSTDERFSDVTRYIAVVDSEMTAKYIPKGMFDNVCMLESESKRKYAIISEKYIGTFYDELEDATV